MIVELIRDNRRIVDRISHQQIDTFVELLRNNKVRGQRLYNMIIHDNELWPRLKPLYLTLTLHYASFQVRLGSGFYLF